MQSEPQLVPFKEVTRYRIVQKLDDGKYRPLSAFFEYPWEAIFYFMSFRTNLTWYWLWLTGQAEVQEQVLQTNEDQSVWVIKKLKGESNVVATN
jgi:hypothetical protein